MSDELQGMSKYQRKQLAKARGQWVAPSDRIEVAVSVKVNPPPLGRDCTRRGLRLGIAHAGGLAK